MVQIQPQNVTKLKFKCLCKKSSPKIPNKNKRTEHKHEFTEQTGSKSKFSKKKTIEQIIELSTKCYREKGEEDRNQRKWRK